MIRPMYRKVYKEIHTFFIPVNQDMDFQQFLIHTRSVLISIKLMYKHCIHKRMFIHHHQ